MAQSSSGTFTLRPYLYFDGSWVGVGFDATTPIPAASLDSTKNNGWTDYRIKSPAFGGYMCLVRETGTGTPGDAFLGIIPNKIK